MLPLAPVTLASPEPEPKVMVADRDVNELDMAGAMEAMTAATVAAMDI